MNKRITIGLIIFLIIAGGIFYTVFSNGNKRKTENNTTRNIQDNSSSKTIENAKINNYECDMDLDCEFIYTKMEHSCPSCKYSSDDWVCAGNESAENWWSEWSRQHSDVQCEMCLESESEIKMFECRCQNNKCVKNKK